MGSTLSRLNELATEAISNRTHLPRFSGPSIPKYRLNTSAGLGRAVSDWIVLHGGTAYKASNSRIRNLKSEVKTKIRFSYRGYYSTVFIILNPPPTQRGANPGRHMCFAHDLDTFVTWFEQYYINPQSTTNE